MTERKKISLVRPAATGRDALEGGRKPPVRGPGTAPRKRMTAAEAEQARAQAAAREQAEARSPRDRDTSPPRHERVRPEREQARSTPPRVDQRRIQQGAPRRDPSPAHTPDKTPVEADGRLRLSKLMSERGLASRREADEWIEAGWVRIDGDTVAELGMRVFPDVHIDIDPQARQQQVQRVTILLHKPIGYVSGQAEDGYEPAVALVTPGNRWAEDKAPIQLNRGHVRGLAPAGRLDIDSTGLLVLTQDGRVAKALIGEDSGIEKEYLVRVQLMSQPEADNVSALTPPEAIERLRFGMELDGKPLKPAQVSWQNEQQLRVVLREGRKRQIRRMCELVGLKVVGLKRVRMGRVVLGKLPVGQWRFLRPDERF